MICKVDASENIVSKFMKRCVYQVTQSSVILQTNREETSNLGADFETTSFMFKRKPSSIHITEHTSKIIVCT